jgi:hypothetical protein
MKCLYRKGSVDAMIAAFLVNWVFPECPLIPIDVRFTVRGSVEILADETVYVIGFRPTARDFAWLTASCQSLKWYESSHWSDSDEKISGERNPDTSCSRMIYEALCGSNGSGKPFSGTDVIDFIEQWVTRSSGDVAENFVNGLSIIPDTAWSKGEFRCHLFDNPDAVEKIVSTGEIVTRYNDLTWAKLMEARSYSGTFHTRTATIINSDIKDGRAFQGTEGEIGISYVYDGFEFLVNLFADSECYDIPGLAEMYGGRGNWWHSEFTVKRLPAELQHHDRLTKAQGLFVEFGKEFCSLGLVADERFPPDKNSRKVIAATIGRSKKLVDACNRIAIAYRRLKDEIFDDSM